MSVTVNNNSPIQDYVHPDDQIQPTFEMTPGFKPFTKISTLPGMAQGNHPRSPRKERINSRIKESRQFMKILQSAVFLFYVSWLPIVVCIPF